MYQNYMNQPSMMPNQFQAGNPYLDRLQAMTMQQPQPQMMQQAPQQGLIRVTGIDGAKAYQMGPNSAVPLFDANDDVFFVKSTDGAGFPTIRAFRFTPIESAAVPAAASADFITREEFNKFKEAIFNVQQPVREQPDAAESSAGIQ